MANANCMQLGSTTGLNKIYCKGGTASIASGSDKRIKEDITLANTAQCLEDVLRLPVSRFKYKQFAGKFDDIHQTGFIADDVQEVFPKEISEMDMEYVDLDENFNPIYEDVVDEDGNAILNEDGTPQKQEKKIFIEKQKFITYGFAVPTLWGAVQELTKRLEVAEAKIEELSQ